jgi:hypothetical protein
MDAGRYRFQLGETLMNWRVFAASAIGKHHIDVGLPCQDAFSFKQTEGVVFAIVSDGAGSAEHSELGSQLLARDLVDRLAGIAFSALSAEVIVDATRQSRDGLVGLASEQKIPLRDLACTLVGAIASSTGGWMFHIGDGLGIADYGSLPPVVSSPENGEFANETYFITADDWESRLRVLPLQTGIGLIALMSDGAMPFVMDKTQMALFGPFINPVRKYLEGVSEEEGSAGLQATLADERTWSITGDDKSLLIVIASDPMVSDEQAQPAA